MSSDGYTMENIVYEWMSQKPIDFNEHMELPQYTLQHVLLGNCTKTYKESENESSLDCYFIILKGLRLLDVIDGIILSLFSCFIIFFRSTSNFYGVSSFFSIFCRDFYRGRHYHHRHSFYYRFFFLLLCFFSLLSISVLILCYDFYIPF